MFPQGKRVAFLASRFRIAVDFIEDQIADRLPRQFRRGIGAGDDQVAALEKTTLLNAMRQAGGNKSADARHLGISETKIRYMILKYGIEEK